MGLLSGRQLQRFFVQWMQTCHERSEGTLVAIDGKTLRGAADKRIKNSAIHMVSAFCAANRVVLGQVKTDDKSNEITAIPELLKLLELKGCLVSIDAMGCQRKIAEQIVKRDADYLLAVKGNQGKLEQAFSDWYSPMMFKCGEERDDHDGHYATQESGHGRKETRLCIASQDLRPLGDLTFEWPNLTTIGIVATIREEGGKPFNAEQLVLRFYISSRKSTAKELLESSREHWSIEASLHYRLDVGMREDECRIRRQESGENLAVCRHIALNLLTEEESFKTGIKRKQKRANRNNEYLSRVLMGRGLS